MIGIEAAFTGTLARLPDLKLSKAGKTWCALLVRVGEGDVAQWVQVAAFQEMAETAGKLDKGANVYVEGRLTLKSWTAQDGTDRHGLNVAATVVMPIAQIGRRKPKQDRGARVAASDWQRPLDREPAGMDQEIPF